MLDWKLTKGRRVLYWSMQLLGWGAYFGYFAIYISRAGNWKLTFIQWPVVAVSHLLGSHALRAVIRGRHWVGVPINRLAPRLIGAMILIDIPVQIPCFLTAICIMGPAAARQYALLAPFYLIVAVVLYCIWSALYFGFQYPLLYRDAELERVRLQASLREAELQALRSQVNPHFLFNCLNNMRSLVMEDPPRVREMLLRLSELLRHALEAVRHESISLGKELHVVESYLELEKLQFEERLRWSVEVAEDAKDASIPPMLLQQLVENAVKHGISRLPGGGTVQIRASVAEDQLALSVENSGKIGAAAGSGVGLHNARERLRLFRGTKASLALEQLSPNLVRASVICPVHNS